MNPCILSAPLDVERCFMAAERPGALLGRFLRWLPVGMRGKARLARWLLGSALDAKDVALDLAGVRFVVPGLHETIGFHLFVDGMYEPTTIGWITERLPSGGVFVDVGANVGGLAVPAARHVGSSGRVIAVEASPRIAEYLAKNVSLNRLANVTVCHVAADADSCEAVPFYEAARGDFGMGALTPDYGGTATSVPSMRLDDLLESLEVGRVNVLKIDVEGFEGRVLAGAQRLLHGPHPPDVLFEYYDWAERAARIPGEAQRLLVEAGYQLWTLDGWLRREAPLRESVTGGWGGNMVAIHSRGH